jgi:hypothetical protein
MYNIGTIEEGDYYVKFHLFNRSDNFKCALVGGGGGYGPAQDGPKEFLG